MIFKHSDATPRPRVPVLKMYYSSTFISQPSRDMWGGHWKLEKDDHNGLEWWPLPAKTNSVLNEWSNWAGGAAGAIEGFYVAISYVFTNGQSIF